MSFIECLPGDHQGASIRVLLICENEQQHKYYNWSLLETKQYDFNFSVSNITCINKAYEMLQARNASFHNGLSNGFA